MEKLDKLYEKFHASCFGILGVAIFLVGAIPAMFVHNNFSFLTVFISDLAVPGGNDLAFLFSVCWFITGLFMIMFILGFTRFLQEKGASTKGTWIACILSIVSAIGILMLALFNTRDFDVLHDIAQYVFFFPGILYLFSYAYLEYKLSEFPLWQALLNNIVAFFFILYLVLFIINRVDETLLVEAKVVAEWLFLFSNLFWFVETGAFILKK
ncbi:MAG: DUF998 domain-containing protein [Candidatus Lokiarchaeota archaeon]|nr:DUF998 domain-containing protein [Candidatus Lokiarchaeota archaeon]